MGEMIKPEWLKCPKCNHMQKDRETCEYCGASLAKIIRIKKLEQRLHETEQKTKDAEHRVSEFSSERTGKYEPSRKQIIINRLIISVFGVAAFAAIISISCLIGAANKSKAKTERRRQYRLHQKCSEDAVLTVAVGVAEVYSEDFATWYIDKRKWDQRGQSWKERQLLSLAKIRECYKGDRIIEVRNIEYPHLLLYGTRSKEDQKVIYYYEGEGVN